MKHRFIHTLKTLNPASGGPARSVPQLAIALVERGHEVALWTPGLEVCALADLSPEIESCMRLLSGPFDEAIDDFGRPDVVHDHGIWALCHREVGKVCRERCIPRIVSPRGMLEPWALNHKKWKKRAAWWLYQRRDLESATLLHTTAKSEAEQLKNLGLKAPIVVVPNGVTIPTLHPDSEGPELRNEKTALFLSRVQKKKGLPLWVEAWARVKPAGWKMRVVGPEEDGHRAEVKALVAKHGLQDSWSFEDSLEGEAKWQAMAEADLFVLPTHSENFGIVVAEALASRTPVLTTKGAPWQDLVTHDCGWWVDPTVDGLEKGFRGALSRIDDFPEMGGRGRTWVERDFGWEGIAEKMFASYEWLLGIGDKPDCVI